jgi:hypothetical protein
VSTQLNERDHAREHLIERFLRHVEITDGCWLWAGSRTKLGYGQFSVSAALRGQFAHRVSFELFAGPIPEGLELDHLCRTPACVRPSHLEAVTHRENLFRSEAICTINARKTRCPKGHPYDRVKKNGDRFCGVCATERERLRSIAKREARHAAKLERRQAA